VDFEDVVRKRRMVRSFTDEPVSDEALRRILRTAQRGPSAGFSQGVELVVVTDPGRRHALAGGKAGVERARSLGMQPFAFQAPVHIVVCAGPEVYKARYREEDKLRLRNDIDDDILWQVPYWHTDAGATMMLILLAVVNAGLAAAFVGPGPRQSAVKDLLGIPDDWIAVGSVLIGHEAPDARMYGDVGVSTPRGRRPAEEVVHWQRW
jgi:nitroreductase